MPFWDQYLSSLRLNRNYATIAISRSSSPWALSRFRLSHAHSDRLNKSTHNNGRGHHSAQIARVSVHFIDTIIPRIASTHTHSQSPHSNNNTNNDARALRAKQTEMIRNDMVLFIICKIVCLMFMTPSTMNMYVRVRVHSGHVRA